MPYLIPNYTSRIAFLNSHIIAASFRKETRSLAVETSTSDIMDSHGPIPSRSRQPRFQPSWRSGSVGCATATTIVFFLNLIITITLAAKKSPGASRWRQILHEGNCDQVAKLNTGIHVLINAFSTVLLSSSNYCMQCLSAPTREEVDKAHQQRKWLDVGVMSVRNLTRIETRRVVLWWMLGISSLPLHLLYVSTQKLTGASANT